MHWQTVRGIAYACPWASSDGSVYTITYSAVEGLDDQVVDTHHATVFLRSRRDRRRALCLRRRRRQRYREDGGGVCACVRQLDNSGTNADRAGGGGGRRDRWSLVRGRWPNAEQHCRHDRGVHSAPQLPLQVITVTSAPPTGTYVSARTTDRGWAGRDAVRPARRRQLSVAEPRTRASEEIEMRPWHALPRLPMQPV